MKLKVAILPNGVFSQFGKNSNINVAEAEQHPEILICCLLNKGITWACTFKKCDHRTSPIFSFWVLKFVKYIKSLNYSKNIVSRGLQI